MGRKKIGGCAVGVVHYGRPVVCVFIFRSNAVNLCAVSGTKDQW